VDGTATLINSTVSGNSAPSGGGIFDEGETVLINTTIAGNVASFDGGGLVTDRNNQSTLINTTITGNRAGNEGGGGIAVDVDGVFGGNLMLVNSIVLGNDAPTGAETIGDSKITATGLNIVGEGADTDPTDGIINANPTDVFATTAANGSATAGALGDNGGSVQTVALSGGATNPALDAGLDNAPLGVTLVESVLGFDINGDGDTGDTFDSIDDFLFDARGPGFARASDLTGVANNGTNIIDIGAFEVQNTVAIAPPNPAAIAEGDDGTTPFVFTLTRTLTNGAASVSFAVTGTGANAATEADFGGAFPTGIATFADGEATTTITVNVTGDTTREPDETFTVTLSNPTNVTLIPNGNTATATISNDDGVEDNTPPTVADLPTDVVVTEDVVSDVDLSAATFADVDGDNLTLTLMASEGTLSGMTAGNVTVTGSGTDTLILTGAPDDINAFLDTTSNVQYLGLRNVNGDDAATVTVSANDGTVTTDLGMFNLDITSVVDPWELDIPSLELSAATYQFFTGSIPVANGFEFLIASDDNPTDLNDPYYEPFNQENRYINFSNNLGSVGEGAPDFLAQFGNLSFEQTVRAAFEEIIGSVAVTAAGRNPEESINFFLNAFDFYSAVANERVVSATVDFDQAVKVVAIGSILNEALKDDIGSYADAINPVINEIVTVGTTDQYGMDLFPVA